MPSLHSISPVSYSIKAKSTSASQKVMSIHSKQIFKAPWNILVCEENTVKLISIDFNLLNFQMSDCWNMSDHWRRDVDTRVIVIAGRPRPVPGYSKLGRHPEFNSPTMSTIPTMSLCPTRQPCPTTTQPSSQQHFHTVHIFDVWCTREQVLQENYIFPEIAHI